MKEHIMIACLAAVVSLAAGTAHAGSFNGKLGVTGKLGFVVPADNESDFLHNSTDVGLVGGGGLIYSIDDRLAAELEATHSTFGSETGDFGVTDVSLGGQYRFKTTQRQLVPYLGLGMDVLVSNYRPYDGSNRDVDTTVGAHLSGGFDYFVRRELALTAELKGILAPNAAITNRFGDHVGNFDPSCVTSTVGVRYFFK